MSILEEIKKYADNVHNLNLDAVCNREKDISGEVRAVLLSDIEKVLEKDCKVCELCSLFTKCQIRKLFDLKYCSQFERE